MPAGVVIYRQFESSDINAFSHASAEPVAIAVDDSKILFSEVMPIVASVLEYRRLVFTTEAGGGGEMFFHTRT